MKKIYFPFVLLVFTFLTFSSCVQDNEPDQSTPQSDFYQNLEGAEYLNYYTTPKVFFNMVKVNEAEQTIDGWFVDETGKVYTYNVDTESFPVIEPIIHIGRITLLRDIGEFSGTTIDLKELVDYYKQTRRAANGDFELGHGEPTATTSYYFNAYDLKLGNGECLNCPVSQVSKDENAQLVLKAEGTLTGEIDFPDARDIVKWMSEIDEGL